MWQHQLGRDTGHGQDEARRTVPHGAGQSTSRARGCTATGKNSGKGPEEDEVKMSAVAMQEPSGYRGRQQTQWMPKGKRVGCIARLGLTYIYYDTMYKIDQRRAWQPTHIFFPGGSHGL